MKIVFAGSPEYSLPTLRSLCACGEVVGVLTQPDKPVGSITVRFLGCARNDRGV